MAQRIFAWSVLLTALAAGCGSPDAPFTELAIRSASIEGVMDGAPVSTSVLSLRGRRVPSMLSFVGVDGTLMEVCTPEPGAPQDPYSSIDGASRFEQICTDSTLMLCNGDHCAVFPELESEQIATAEGQRLMVDAFNGTDTVHITVEYTELR